MSHAFEKEKSEQVIEPLQGNCVYSNSHYTKNYSSSINNLVTLQNKTNETCGFHLYTMSRLSHAFHVYSKQAALHVLRV